MMERFNYPNLAAVQAESTELLYLLECESFGRKQDEQEEMEEMRMQTEADRLATERGSVDV